MRTSGILNHQRSNTLSSDPGSGPADGTAKAAQQTSNVDATMAHIEQVRLLILGMEQRLQLREDKLMKNIERAETRECEV
ncbi:hypothetical protein A0H81_01318 [Grifola frondosa]|uniref:Uncharacterized protein n=1 Tax=Grifola frondosa TaxID=5627 RepID=A0A1C7MQI9_GRIFR|nr:hypothetical protein A0H81_01318 [Grifola frondosa]